MSGQLGMREDIDGLDDAGVAPPSDAVDARVRDVGSEARAHLLRRLFLLSEQAVGRRPAVLYEVELVDFGDVVAAPGEVIDLADRQAGRGQGLVEIATGHRPGCKLVEKFVLFHGCTPECRFSSMGSIRHYHSAEVGKIEGTVAEVIYGSPSAPLRGMSMTRPPSVSGLKS